MRVALSYYVANGLVVAIGLALIAAGVQFWLGAAAGAAASVGVLVATPPDAAAPRRGKIRQLLLAPLMGIPLFFTVQVLHADPLRLGLLLVLATFVAFLTMAWGKRGIPIAISAMFAMLFSMATPPPASLRQCIETTLQFSLGAGLYLLWSVLANLVLNARYRVQFSADLLLSLAALIRTQAEQFSLRAEAGIGGRLLRDQAALADQLQATCNIVLESPRTPQRQKLASMLMVVLEMRDHLLASELDLDALRGDPATAAALPALRQILEELAGDLCALADSMLLMRTAPIAVDRRPRLAEILLPQDTQPATGHLGPTAATLARAMANRIGHLNDELLQLSALARGERAPDLALIRANWPMFVSPTGWTLAPLFQLWRWDAPPLRHAIRAALAIGAGWVIAVWLPWGSHDYWILLTIVVVLRGSLSQTLERRNHRVAGTLLGCVLALGLLSTHLPPLVLLACISAAQAIGHAFAVRRYLITAVAATVLGLVQAHMLNTGASPTFALFERVMDTLIGTALAWAFCYVLPSWERHQIPALVIRVLRAQARHAKLALGLGRLSASSARPQLDWQLARREAYDSLAALVQATQRSLSEPRAVRPPVESLEYLQAHAYQLLAQLSAVKSMLVLRRDRLTPSEIETPIARATAAIETALTPPTAGGSGPHAGAATFTSDGPVPLPDLFGKDISPWLLRRLDFATRIAFQLQDDAARVLYPAIDQDA